MTVSGGVSGSGSITNNGSGTVIFAANNGYSGGTVVNAGTVQFGTGGAPGIVNGNSTMVDNGTIIFNTTTPVTIDAGNVTGTGNMIIRAGKVIIQNSSFYTGWTEIDPGALFEPCYGQANGMETSVITNNGTLKFVSQNANPATFGVSNNIVGTGQVWMDIDNQNVGWAVLAGTNTYTGGTVIGGGGLVLGDGLTPGAGSIVGSVTFTNTTGPTTSVYSQNRLLIFNRADNITFTNAIFSAVSDGSATSDSGSVEQLGPGNVTLTGSDNFPGGATIGAGAILQIGAGGTGGSVGSGAISDGGTLVFDHSDSVTVNGIISDNTSASSIGALVQLGSGTLTLAATNTYTGSTTVSNGTLVVSSGVIGGSLDIEGGTYVGGSLSTIVTNAIAGSLAIDSGTVVATLNKSQSPSNTLYSVSGSITCGAGTTLKVVNAGPGLAVGDKFVIFSAGVQNGAGMTVTGAGATWANNLAADGSITALTVTPAVNVNPPSIQISVSGNALNLGWPTNRGWTLLTNSVGLNATGQWYPYPGSAAGTNVSIPFVSGKNVFFRMVYTNTP